MCRLLSAFLLASVLAAAQTTADLSRQVQFNLAAYYTDYTNLQSATRTPLGQSLLQNAGKFTATVDVRLCRRAGLLAMTGCLRGSVSCLSCATLSMT